MDEPDRRLLRLGDAVRHHRLGIGVVGEPGAPDLVVHFFPNGWARVARADLELLEACESLLAMLDGTWHLGVERLKAAVVWLRLDDPALYRPAALHFAVCPELMTTDFLSSYLKAQVRPARVQKLRRRIRDAREEVSQAREEGARVRMEDARVRMEDARVAEARYVGRPEVRAATRRGIGEAREAHMRRIDARLAELGAPPLTMRQLTSMRRDYKNICWQCHEGVNSDNAIPCSACGWYVCRACGRCRQYGCTIFANHTVT